MPSVGVFYRMQHCLHLAAGILTIGSLLLSGCASSKSTHATKSKSGSSTIEQAAKSEPVFVSKPVDDKLVQAHAHYAQGVMHDMAEDSEKALEEYAKSAQLDPDNEQLILELSRRYLQKKEPEKAADILVKATASSGASGAIFAQLGWVYLRLGKDELAIEASQTAIKLLPKSLAGYHNIFLIHLQKGRAPEALKVLNQAAKQEDVTAEYLIDLAELYSTLEKQAPTQKEFTKPGALAVLNRAAKLNPETPLVRMKLADGFNVFGDSANAVQIYLQLLNRYGDRLAVREDVRAKLADIYLRGKDPQKAMEQLKAIVQDDPANAQAYYYLGNLAIDQKKLPEAADFFRKTLLLSDDFEQVYYDLASVQMNLDQTKEALETLEKARKKFQGGFVLEFFTAMVYSHDKNYTNAIQHFTSAELIARATEPKRLNQLFYFQVGSTYEREGNLEQAEEYFNKCLQISPNFPEALNYFGYMLADKGIKLEKAHELIEKAVKLEPKNAAYLDSLGWVLYKLNQPKEALENIQKAIELSEEVDATLYDHLGDIYVALKLNDKAREAWSKSLKVEPNEQVRKKLDQIKGQ
ncbi:MAG: Tetratricopeptide 2 repeat protein [Pedosphaera sp.]|nr:Tetratricopeptide 2 repeat protein [Pedosphaera sp.]